MKRQFLQLLIRIVANAAAIFVAAIFVNKLSYQDSFVVLLISATILSIINAVIRPVVVIFSLPAYIFTLGLFSIVVNALMLYLVDLLYAPFEVSGLVAAILAGIVVGLVNYILTRIFDGLTDNDSKESS